MHGHAISGYLGKQLMARTINFVRDRRQSISRQVKQDRAILRYVIYSLIIIGVVMLMVLAVRLFLIFRIQMITNAQKEVTQAILEKEELERDYTIFAHKLTAITDLFGKRREKQEALAYFSSLFGPNVVISQLSYTAGEEILSFTIDSPSVFVLDEVFEIMNSSEVREKYPQIVKNSLSRASNGRYGMAITLPLGDSPLDSIGEEGEDLEGVLDQADQEPLAEEDEF